MVNLIPSECSIYASASSGCPGRSSWRHRGFGCSWWDHEWWSPASSPSPTELAIRSGWVVALRCPSRIDRLRLPNFPSRWTLPWPYWPRRWPGEFYPKPHNIINLFFGHPKYIYIYILTKSAPWLSNCWVANIGFRPTARLWANREATVFFFGFETPRPKLRGLPSLKCTKIGKDYSQAIYIDTISDLRSLPLPDPSAAVIVLRLCRLLLPVPALPLDRSMPNDPPDWGSVFFESDFMHRFSGASPPSSAILEDADALPLKFSPVDQSLDKSSVASLPWWPPDKPDDLDRL